MTNIKFMVLVTDRLIPMLPVPDNILKRYEAVGERNMRDHTKLRAFELADEVTILIYQLTQCFPKEEIYGLTSQMRRAAVSAASNIVEG